MKVASPVTFDAIEVGASLREARTALQRDLMEAASDLRIRHVYLAAIEDGRLNDLPGPAYTTGFLRAYGDYLGLNGRELVDRFKAAGGGTTGQTDLHLPSPIEEGRLPTGSVLLLAALLAVGVYGGWYYMASNGDDPVEKVAALPDRLASIVGETPSPEIAAPSADAGVTGVDEDGGRDSAGAFSSLEDDDTADEPRSVALADDEEEPPATDAPRTNGHAQPTLTTGPVAVSAPPEAPKIQSEVPALRGETPRALVRRHALEALDGNATETAPLRRNPGVGGITPLAGITSSGDEADAASRIVLRANTDSWVEVRSGGASPVFSGLLRRGDTYNVPEEPGLTMMTGNAGGIDILIDGKAIPRLGPPGSIKRNVLLDADILLGQAGSR